MKSICVGAGAIALCIIALICVMVTLRYHHRSKILNGEKLTFGEDLYQQYSAKKNRKYKSVLNAIFTFDIVDPIRRKEIIDEVVINTDKFTKSYFKKYKYIYKKIENKKLYIENSKNSIYDNIDEHTVCPLLLIYSYDDSKILIIMDHVYIGGYFFQEWGTTVFKGETVNPYHLNYQPGLTELIALKFMLCKAIPSYIGHSDSLTLIDNRDQLKRFGLKIDIEKIKVKNINPKVYIIHYLAKLLLKYLSINRGLNILLPVAFENDDYVYNNVGGIFINVGKDDSIEDVSSNLMNNRYNAIATNSLMQILNKGKTARQKIDVIMTIGFIKKPTLLSTNELQQIEISFSNVVQYGIYCASFAYGTVAHVSVTVNTKKFAYDSLMKYESNVFEIKH